MRALVVEDDFTSRLLLQTCLSKYGDCHVAVNGREAIEAFRSAREQRRSYDLICLDIMMPEVDGLAALRAIRKMEADAGVLTGWGVRVIMTTALSDAKNVFGAFKHLCDAYLTKPVSLQKLTEQLRTFDLLPASEETAATLGP